MLTLSIPPLRLERERQAAELERQRQAMMNAQQSALDGRGKGGFTFSEVDVRSLTTIAPTTEILANGL